MVCYRCDGHIRKTSTVCKPSFEQRSLETRVGRSNSANAGAVTSRPGPALNIRRQTRDLGSIPPACQIWLSCAFHLTLVLAVLVDDDEPCPPPSTPGQTHPPSLPGLSPISLSAHSLPPSPPPRDPSGFLPHPPRQPRCPPLARLLNAARRKPPQFQSDSCATATMTTTTETCWIPRTGGKRGNGRTFRRWPRLDDRRAHGVLARRAGLT